MSGISTIENIKILIIKKVFEFWENIEFVTGQNKVGRSGFSASCDWQLNSNFTAAMISSKFSYD
jgi:hypothetical protein